MTAGVFHPPGATAAVVAPRTRQQSARYILIGLLGLLQAGMVVGQPAPAEPRFAVRATLEAEPEPASNARFSLRGTLAPQSTASVSESVGFVLKADLLAKGGDTCIFPQLLFADGFESSTP